jgi:hypothetical protein
MITRHITPSMIYVHTAPARWLRSLTTAREETAASLCQAHWQQGAASALSPVPIDEEACRERGPSGSLERPAR